MGIWNYIARKLLESQSIKTYKAETDLLLANQTELQMKMQELSETVRDVDVRVHNMQDNMHNLVSLNGNNDLLYSSTIETYIDKLLEIREKVLILIAVKDTCGLHMNATRAKSLQKLGIYTNLEGKHGYGYIGIINKGEVLFDTLSDKSGTIVFNECIDNLNIDIISSTYTQRNIASVRIDYQSNCAVNERGINFVVYDIDKKVVIDSVCFDTHVKQNIILRDNENRRYSDNIWKKIRLIDKKYTDSLEEIKLSNLKTEMLLWGILRNGELDDLSAKKKFFEQMPRASGLLRKVQKANLFTLIKFDEICRKNNIQYWLSFGALIGAVRHRGFIPWDDDIDVCIMRDELEKIESAFAEDEWFKQINFVALSGVNICHKLHYRRDGAPYDLDIFVYDYCIEFGENVIEEQDRLKKELVSEISKVEKKNNQCENELKKVEYEIIQKYMLKANKLLRLTTSKEEANGIIWGIENFRYAPAKRSSVYLEEIFPLTEVTLEGYSFKSPKNPENYLNRMYGDIYSIPDDIISHKHFELEKIDKDVLNEIVRRENEVLKQ